MYTEVNLKQLCSTVFWKRVAACKLMRSKPFKVFEVTNEGMFILHWTWTN